MSILTSSNWQDHVDIEPVEGEGLVTLRVGSEKVVLTAAAAEDVGEILSRRGTMSRA